MFWVSFFGFQKKGRSQGYRLRRMRPVRCCFLFPAHAVF